MTEYVNLLLNFRKTLDFSAFFGIVEYRKGVMQMKWKILICLIGVCILCGVVGCSEQNESTSEESRMSMISAEDSVKSESSDDKQEGSQSTRSEASDEPSSEVSATYSDEESEESAASRPTDESEQTKWIMPKKVNRKSKRIIGQIGRQAIIMRMRAERVIKAMDILKNRKF